MKSLKAILPIILAVAGVAFSQNQVTLSTVAPQGAVNVQSFISGTAGTATACYWVVANFPGGSIISSPTCQNSTVPNTLSSGNKVVITWSLAQGATTYDVLKTTTSSYANGSIALSTALGATVTTASDIGGGLSAYTLAGFTYQNLNGILRLNNRDYATPQFELIPYGINLSSNATPGQGSTFNIAQLNDVNGKPLLTPTATVSAVNGLAVTNSATGNAVLLTTGGSGSDTNVALNVIGKGSGAVNLGNVTTPFAITSTGDATGVIYNSAGSITISNLNAGVTTIVTAVTGRTLKVVGLSLQAIGGAFGTCTAVVLQDTAGSPVAVATAAIAALTQNTIIHDGTANVTPGTIFAALTADKGLGITKTGGACDTATSVKYSVNYTIN